ncbi:hypothetical protein SBBP2_140032 [Burkholderiales bacterium]|nr:hypothetical protein SBBP2_140032 [Burkholderiales bacterium]
MSSWPRKPTAASRGPSATHTSGATRSTRSHASSPTRESSISNRPSLRPPTRVRTREFITECSRPSCLPYGGRSRLLRAGQQSRPGLGLPWPCRDDCSIAARRNLDSRRRRQCGRCRRARPGRPVRMGQLRIERAGETDVDWLLTILNREGSVLGTSFAHCSGGPLPLRSCGHEPTRSNATGGCANVGGGSAP